MKELLDCHSILVLLEATDSENVSPIDCLIVGNMDTNRIQLLERCGAPAGAVTEYSLTLAHIIYAAATSFAGWSLDDVFLIMEKDGDDISFGVAKRTALEKPN